MTKQKLVNVEVNLTIKGGRMSLLLPEGYSHDELCDAIGQEISHICNYNILSFDAIIVKEEK